MKIQAYPDNFNANPQSDNCIYCPRGQKGDVAHMLRVRPGIVQGRATAIDKIVAQRKGDGVPIYRFASYVQNRRETIF